MENLSKYLKYLGALVVALLLVGSGWFVRELGARSDMESVLKDHEIQLQEIEVVRTKNTSLVKALASAGEDREVLLDEIASLSSKPPEIRYITRVETVIEGGETVVVNHLPENHMFRLDNGLPVAQFSVEAGENDGEPEYHFDVADLTVSASVVLGERDSAISLRMESDLDPGNEQEIPVAEFEVKHIREQKVFEPHVLVGASASAGPTGVGVGPHFAVSLFHPKSEFDLVSVRVGSSSGRVQVGLDPVLYNLGEPMPVITNLWVGAGVSVDTTGQFAGTVSIGAKL